MTCTITHILYMTGIRTRYVSYVRSFGTSRGCSAAGNCTELLCTRTRTYVCTRTPLVVFLPDVGAKNSSSRLPIGQSSRNESRLIANQQQLPDLQLGVASMNIFAQDDAYLGGAVCTNKSW